MYEQSQVLSINSHSRIEHITLPCENWADGFARFSEFLKSEDLPPPQILASTFSEGHWRIMFTGDESLLTALMESVKQQQGLQSLRSHLSSVTLTCCGSPSPQLLDEAVSLLSAGQIDVYKVIQSPQSISLFVDPKDREGCISILHSLISSNF